MLKEAQSYLIDGVPYSNCLADDARNLYADASANHSYNLLDRITNKLFEIMSDTDKCDDLKNFAKEIGIKKKRINNILAGECDSCTIKDIAFLFHKLGYRLDFTLTPIEEQKEVDQ